MELVERVPAEDRRDRIDAVPALAPVELRCSVDVISRGDERNLRTVRPGLDEMGSGHPEVWVSHERVLDRLEGGRRELEVRVHLGDDVPLDVESVDGPLERLQLARLCE